MSARHDALSVSRSILGALLDDGALAEHRSHEVVVWLAGDATRLGERSLAWAAARASEVAFAEIDAGATPKVPRDTVEAFRALAPPTRVIVALHELCGLSDPEVAAATGQPLDRVVTALDQVGPPPAGAPPVDLPPPVTAPPAAPEPRPTTAAPPVAATPLRPPSSTPPGTPGPAPRPFPGPGARSTGPVDLTESMLPPAAPVEPSAQRRRRRTAQPKRGTPRWWLVAAIVVLALVAAGIAANNLRDDEPTTPSKPATGLTDPTTLRRDEQSRGCGTAEGDAASELTTAELEVGGAKRTYRVAAGAPLEPGQPRTLMVLAGDVGETADQLADTARVSQLATALQLVVVVLGPSEGVPQWNVAGSSDDPDDLAFVDQVLTAESASRCINPRRIIVGGHGAGAHFAAEYVCTRPGMASGLVQVAGVRIPPSCKVPSSLSILAVLGDADEVLPLDGSLSPAFESLFGDDRREGSVYDLDAPTTALDEWADVLGCSGTASQSLGLVTMLIDPNCDRGGEVWRVVLPGAGHEWYPATYDLLVQFLTSAPLDGDGS